MYTACLYHDDFSDSPEGKILSALKRIRYVESLKPPPSSIAEMLEKQKSVSSTHTESLAINEKFTQSLMLLPLLQALLLPGAFTVFLASGIIGQLIESNWQQIAMLWGSINGWAGRNPAVGLLFSILGLLDIGFRRAK
jgi:hypothetical protein